MPPVYSYQGQVGVDTVSVTGSGNRIDFQSTTLAADETFIDCNGLRGTRSRAIERIRAGNRRIGGNLIVEPTALELSKLLPWALGAGAASPTFALADLLPTRYVMVDKGANVMVYNAVAVNRLTIDGNEGLPLRMTFDLVGGDESIGASGTFPALTLDTTTSPFIFTDCTASGISINSTNPLGKNFQLVVDNAIDENRFYNSQTLTAEIAADRHVTLNLTVPFGTASALYNLGAGGTAVTFTFTNAADTNLVLTLVMPKVAFPRKPIAVQGREEVVMPYPGTAYKSGSTNELTVTLAYTP